MVTSALQEFVNVVPHPTSYTTPARGDMFIPGELIHVAPMNMRTYLDLSSLPGVSSRIVTPFLYYLGRNRFQRYKLFEWSEVSPVHAQFYQLTIQQKQQLENLIKQGLASISSAVSDFDLLLHDQRKYREFLDYFEAIEKGKKVKNEDLMMKNEQTLKSIFIDQVDVHTGEGIALKLIASRWPTIIVDFLKLKDEDTDPKKIAEKLKVTEAEGVVLATKNKLYVKWKELFRETVLGRFNRISELVEARRKSIQEYRNYLRPIIERFRNIRELGETEEGRRILNRSVSWARRGVSEAYSMDIQVIWAWKGMSLPDLFKRSKEAFIDEYDLLKYPKFPKGFKEWIKTEMPTWSDENKNRYRRIRDYHTGIEPIDKWVLAFIPVAERVWNVKLTALDILRARQWMINDGSALFPNWPYFKVWEITIVRGVTRYADGVEIENPMFDPWRPYLDSQNVVLMRYIELVAKEKQSENYITDLLGETAQGKRIAEIIEERYPELKAKYPELFGTTFVQRPLVTEKEMKKVTETKERVISAMTMKMRDWANSITRGLVKSAPYETNFENLITRQYFREIRDTMWVPANNYLRSRYGIPGFKSGP
ncbi:MAG: hypothetical protein HY361_02935 [Candidatus Aenigmarchaeota archaeon]|nr:hypothetical protein [Candidatus Aenigmarchaeota archaeon]